MYTLYLDESMTHDNGCSNTFAIAGFIIEDSQTTVLKADIEQIKDNLWASVHADPKSIILHEKDIK